MLDLLNPYKYMIEAVLLAALMGGAAMAVHKYNDWIRQPLVDQIEREHAELKAQSDKVKADADAKTASIKSEFATLDGVKNEQIKNLNTTLASAVAGLRNRPERPSASGVPGSAADAKSGAGCTGSGLFRPDGEFLSRFAAATSRLQLELKACYAKYDEVAAKVNGK